jgi:hypothetical protein|tara:strand:- start:1241 stop:1489 length:249 start_codon:yes stop_codon:yes gene_type:complete
MRFASDDHGKSHFYVRKIHPFFLGENAFQTALSPKSALFSRAHIIVTRAFVKTALCRGTNGLSLFPSFLLRVLAARFVRLNR